MVAEFVRVSGQELDRALADPEWAEEYVKDLLDAELDAEEEHPITARRGYVDRTWDALRILAHRAGTLNPCPFLGGTPFGEVWSYDKPRHETQWPTSGAHMTSWSSIFARQPPPGTR